MSYQFIHIESYSRKAGKGKAGGNSISDIIAEVTRVPQASSHVQKPEPPDLVFGVDPHQLVEMCESYAVTMISTFNRKNRKTGANVTVTRKMREDGLCMIGGVFSAPSQMPVGTWPQYRKEMINKLKDEFGDRLKSVNEHVDESYRHCHFYIIPLPGEHFDNIHPGKRSASAVSGGGVVKGLQNKAYNDAMRKWQDEYWMDVSKKYGLARVGPKLKRSTRPGWAAQQALVILNAQTLQDNEIKSLALRNKEVKLNIKEANLERLFAQARKVETLGGRVGMIFGGFVVATQFIKEWLVLQKIWPGISQVDEEKARAQKAINSLQQEKKILKDEFEIVKTDLSHIKADKARLDSLLSELSHTKLLLTESEHHNQLLAEEVNELSRLLKPASANKI